VDLDPVEVRDHEEGRVLQGVLVIDELAIAARRSLRLPLYSQAKKPFFQTSAKPSPPSSFSAPFSNA